MANNTPHNENYYAYKHHRLARVSDALTSTLHAIIKWGSLLGIAYVFGDAFKSLAGKETFTSIAVQFFTHMQADRWIAYILTGGSVAYGLKERRLRKKTVKNLTSRISELERIVHPDRTSSGLNPMGSAPEE